MGLMSFVYVVAGITLELYFCCPPFITEILRVCGRFLILLGRLEASLLNVVLV